MHKLTIMARGTLFSSLWSAPMSTPPLPATVSAPLPISLTVPVAIGAFLFFTWAERRWPLRRQGAPPNRRLLRNLAVAGSSAVALFLVERPVVLPLARSVGLHRQGLLGLLDLPPWLEVAAGVVLLDYTLYLWHVLTHRVPLLWRFHLVHHLDLDLDASTALRFHFGELSLSVAFRAAQLRLLGISPLPLSIWQSLLFVSVLFHHSNLSLSPRVERLLSRVFMTPHLHGIHHAAARAETDSNWSSGLSILDRLHGTFRTTRTEPRTGVPAYRDEAELTLGKLLALPFGKERPAFTPAPALEGEEP